MQKEWLFISLGAGVQSTALMLLYYHGKLTPMPDAALFADTQGEPPYVYENLKRLSDMVKDKFPVLTETRGNLLEDELNPERYVSVGGKHKGKKFPKCPFYFASAGREGMGRRQCTADYKVDVLHKGIRRFMGYKPRQRIRGPVQFAVGISTDEWMRMKDSHAPWVKNIWPLVDLRFSRSDCLRYIKELQIPEPMRSACYFCPFRSNEEWLEMKRRSPETFALAVDFDHRLREVKNFFKPQYVHRSCEPLSEVQLENDNHPSLFESLECEGMCGV